MPEPDLIQQQRDILAGFRQATAERARAEADAEARRQREREAADAALRKAQQEAETQRAKALTDAEARQKADRTAAEAGLGQARRTGDAAVNETSWALREARDNLARVGLGDLVNAEARPTAPQPGADPASQLSQAVAVATGAPKDVREKVAELLRLHQAAAIRRRLLTIFGAIVAVVVLVGGFLVVRAIQRAAEVARQEAEVARQDAAAEAAIKAGPVLVPAGEFTMGSMGADSTRSSDERPQHKVYLDAFLIDRTEVTNAMYAKCVAAGVCKAPSDIRSSTRSKYYDDTQYANYPVINVSWDAAQVYCKWAGGRLPTEAEWEKAARGPSTGSGDGHIYPWGDAPPDVQRANFANNVGDTTPVGAYAAGASPYGALDMAGNVWEWVADWYDETYYASASARNPPGPGSGQDRVLRGGSWKHDQWAVRAATRNRMGPGNVYYLVGFRCARSP